jgi:hypothetical protein
MSLGQKTRGFMNTVPLLVQIPDELRVKVRVAALESRTTVAKFVADALVQALVLREGGAESVNA